VLTLGSQGRAARAAVDAGRRHPGEEPPVEPAVAARHRPVAGFEVVEHGSSQPVTRCRSWRKSDITSCIGMSEDSEFSEIQTEEIEIDGRSDRIDRKSTRLNS